MPSNAAASIYQVGTQSAFDTAVAATARLAVPNVQFQETDNVNRPRLANGLAVRNRGHEFVQARGVTVSVPASPLAYEQAAGFFGAAVDGGVTPVGVGPYTYTFTRNPLALPALSLWTLERRISDYTNHTDYEWPNVALTQLTLSGQANGEVQVSAEGFGGARAASTLTAAQTMPAVEHVPFPLSELWLDANWAAIGTSQITGKVLNWGLDIMTGAVGLPVADGRANLDYGVLVYNSDQIGHTFRARMLQTKTQYEAEVAAAEAQTLRGIRIAMAGTSSRAINVDFLCRHESGSLTVVDESDGQVVFDVSMVDATDGTNSLEAVVVNNADNEWGT